MMPEEILVDHTYARPPCRNGKPRLPMVVVGLHGDRVRYHITGSDYVQRSHIHYFAQRVVRDVTGNEEEVCRNHLAREHATRLFRDLEDIDPVVVSNIMANECYTNAQKIDQLTGLIMRSCSNG